MVKSIKGGHKLGRERERENSKGKAKGKEGVVVGCVGLLHGTKL